MSCKTTSNLEFANTTPVSPPTVNRKINPIAHKALELYSWSTPWKVLTHLKIFTPVGTAMIIVAVVK